MKNLNPTQLLRLLAVAILLSFLAACSDDDKSEYGTLDSLFKDSKITACGTCHYGPESSDGTIGTGDADLSTKSGFKDALVGKTVSSFGASGNNCSGTLVVPKSPSSSKVLDVISQYNSSQNCDSLGYHEDLNAVLSGSILDEFVAWIRDGAN